MRALFRAAPVALALIAAMALPARGAGSRRSPTSRPSVLLDQAPGRAEAEAQFEKETGRYRDQIKRMSDSLDAMVVGVPEAPGVARRRPRVTRRRRRSRRSRQEYQRRTAELEQKAQARQSELVQPILDKVKAAIEDVRVEGGYAMIFNADQGSPIVAVDKNLNVTDRVLSQAEGDDGVRAAGAAAELRRARAVGRDAPDVDDP